MDYIYNFSINWASHTKIKIKMISLKKFKNKYFAIYGMGKTGIATTKALQRYKIKLSCWDDNRKQRNKMQNLKFPIKKFWNLKNKKNLDYIVISPGININKCKIKSFLKKNINKVITDLDLFFDNNKYKTIISITGTNGKSTTCKILEKIFKSAGYPVQLGGNIGKPVLSLKEIHKKGIYILEISSYQLAYSKPLRSNHAAILNITPDHLDRHVNLNNYIKAKSKIFLSQRNTDFSYLNNSNKYNKKIIKFVKNKNRKSKFIYINKKNYSLLLKKTKNNYFKNEANLENLSFAYEIAKKFGIKDEVIFNTINKFNGLPHRQEIIFSNKKFKFINDSKATSFHSCLQSLKSYDNIYWIVGGLAKDKDNFNLREVSHKIKKAYIIGRQTNKFKNILENNINYSVTHDLPNTFKYLIKDIKNKKENNCTVLLSPGAASFDQFKNFEERGNFFKSIVKEKIKTITNA